jgi:cytoskeletal protein RodZ
MNIDKDSLSYGQHLKSTRLAKGISLEQISRETRVGKDILLSIEREDDEALPAEVFVKGFLRAYAEAVGLDGGEVVDKYASQHQSTRERIAPQQLYTQPIYTHPSRRRWPLLLAVFAALAMLVFISIYLTTQSFSPTVVETHQASSGHEPAATAPPPREPSPDTVHRSVTAPEKAPEKTAEVERPPEPEVQDAAAGSEPTALPEAADALKMTLGVIAKEETWMKIIIDGGKPKEYTLNAGDKLSLQARTAFNLLIGNAGGVDLRFNGRPVGVPGKSGQVIALQFP